MTEDGQAAAVIISALGSVAFGLDQWRRRSSSTTRQIKDDANAGGWQTTVLEQNRELHQQNKELSIKVDGFWTQISELRAKLAQSDAATDLWKYKYGQMEERVSVMEISLKSSNDQVSELMRKIR